MRGCLSFFFAFYPEYVDSGAYCARRCPALRKLFTSAGLQVVAPAIEASLVEVVRSLGPWMMAGDGEGVVLTLTDHYGRRSGGLVKWKTAAEIQGSTPELLLRTLKRLKEHGQYAAATYGAAVEPAAVASDPAAASSGAAAAKAPVQLVDPAVVEMVDRMYAVSTSDCKGRSAKAQAK